MLLQTEHVSKEFNGIYALRDINFQLDAERSTVWWEKTALENPLSSSC